jgi:hypothetical protein
MSWSHPDDVPTSLTRRAYALRGVTLSQNQYAAVVADAYEDIARHVAHELAEKQRAWADKLEQIEDEEIRAALQYDMELKADAVRQAARLIDPEVSDSGV